MRKERKTFSQEFKKEAVALVMEHGYSYAAAGRSLGIRGNLIGRWKRQLEDCYEPTSFFRTFTQ